MARLVYPLTAREERIIRAVRIMAGSLGAILAAVAIMALLAALGCVYLPHATVYNQRVSDCWERTFYAPADRLKQACDNRKDRP